MRSGRWFECEARDRWICAVALLLAACGGGERRAETPSPASTDQSSSEIAPEESAGSEEAPAEPPPPPPPTIVAGETTPIEGAMPTLRITSPRNGTTVRTGNVQLRVQLRGWQLAPDPGNHVHLIVDNEPYIALRDVSGPIDVNAQVAQHLGHELAEGTHVIRMFPSRPTHESVKDPVRTPGAPPPGPGAFATLVVHYRRASPDVSFDPQQPLLTYSRPKGCNPAGQRVLLDFYLTNASLAPEQTRVRWTLDGTSGEITNWVPHYIENLPVGEHTLQLTLIGPDGNPIPGIFNDTTRTFTVAESCEQGAAAPASHH